MLMDAERSTLLLVDVQENLAPVMADPRMVYRNCALLLRAAARLDIPVVASEQYPKGLGHTMGELAALLPEGAAMEKIHFACSAEPAIAEKLAALDRKQVVIAGIEAHVSVLQSALGLNAQGFEVFVVADACSSRLPANHQAALARLAANGIGVVTTEMAVFEWLHRAGTPAFKDMVALIK
jgi:nicotinamidase-related amidase